MFLVVYVSSGGDERGHRGLFYTRRPNQVDDHEGRVLSVALLLSEAGHG